MVRQRPDGFGGNRTRATAGRVRPWLDANHGCTKCRMAQERSALRVVTGCRGVLSCCEGDREARVGAAQAPTAASNAARRVYALETGPRGSVTVGSIKALPAPEPVWPCQNRLLLFFPDRPMPKAVCVHPESQSRFSLLFLRDFFPKTASHFSEIALVFCFCAILARKPLHTFRKSL